MAARVSSIPSNRKVVQVPEEIVECRISTNHGELPFPKFGNVTVEKHSFLCYSISAPESVLKMWVQETDILMKQQFGFGIKRGDALICRKPIPSFMMQFPESECNFGTGAMYF